MDATDSRGRVRVEPALKRASDGPEHTAPRHGLGLRRLIGTLPGAWVWGVLVGALGSWELQAFVQHPRRDHPTLSSLSNDLLRSPSSRAVALVLWLALGIWLARR